MILTLYALFFIILVIALGIIRIAFIKSNTKFFSYQGLILTVFIFSFASIAYFYSAPHQALLNWWAGGKKHYEVMTEVHRLGGIKGIINLLENKLTTNPQDLKGWIILGKLYFSEGDHLAAKNAFQHAYQIDPQNEEAIKYLDSLKTGL